MKLNVKLRLATACFHSKFVNKGGWIFKKMASKMKIDLEEDYEPSDSEEEYTERERKLLKKVRASKKTDESEEEIFAFDESDSEAERFSAASDLDEPTGEDDYMPDSRAWGKDKRSFYNTDFQDKDYDTYTEKEEELANQEQAEALELQKKLAQQLNDADFALDFFVSDEKVEEPQKLESKDLSDLTKRQKLQAFKHEAPEFEGLVKDFEERLEDSEKFLRPAIAIFKDNNIENHPFMKFVVTRNRLIRNYCVNISFYLLLKTQRIAIKNHPVVKRLVQFRKLLTQLDETYEELIKPQIKEILSTVEAENSAKSKKLNILKSLEQVESEEGIDLSGPSEDEMVKEKPDEDSDEEKPENATVDEAGKRYVGYQIIKNKGLTAQKRKELRNPRIKNKIKFKKALVRRKGSVREVRSQTGIYAGESSGIKAFLKRGIKIK